MTALVFFHGLNLICGAVTLGIPAVLAASVLPAMRERERTASGRLASLLHKLILFSWAAIGLEVLSGLLWFVLQAAAMSGSTLAEAATAETLRAVLQTHFGHVMLMRLVLAIVLACCLALVLLARTLQMRVGFLTTASIVAAAGFAAVAWAGHAAASPGYVHLVADASHLLAAGVWLGGLVVLAALFGTARQNADMVWVGVIADATERFSPLGMACVGVLLLTGIINSWILVGTIPALVGTDYGHLLLVKIALFGLMVWLAAVNRFQLSPRIGTSARRRKAGDPVPVIQTLRRNAIIEAILGFLVLGVVSALGTVPPGLHDQPWWPFPWRPSTAAMGLPAVYNEIMVALAMIAMGSAVFLFGIVRRRYRVPAIPVGLGLIACFIPSFRLLTVEAYPTSFYMSRAAYTTSSIAHGGRLYAENCTMCHGARGKGDGAAATSLQVQPADLTAAHVLDHAEGDIFWWLTAGIPESGMPGFADHMSEAERWDLVNWIRTMPVGGLEAGLTPAVTDMAAPRAPDFTFEVAGGEEDTMADRLKRGPLLLVLFSSPASQPRLQQLAASRKTLAAAGLEIIALPLDEKSDEANDPAADFVVRADSSVAAVYRLIATARRDREPPPPTRLEFLIDRDGYLRALWQPGEGGGWDDIPRLVHEVHLLAKRPLAPVAMPMSMHMQMN